MAAFYNAGLGEVSGVTLFQSPADRESAYWLFGMHVDKREDFILAMKERGITTGVVHQRIDRNSVFGGMDTSLEQQALFDETQIHLPIHAGIDMDTAHFIVDSVKKGW